MTEIVSCIVAVDVELFADQTVDGDRLADNHFHVRRFRVLRCSTFADGIRPRPEWLRRPPSSATTSITPPDHAGVWNIRRPMPAAAWRSRSNHGSFGASIVQFCSGKLSNIAGGSGSRRWRRRCQRRRLAGGTRRLSGFECRNDKKTHGEKRRAASPGIRPPRNNPPGKLTLLPKLTNRSLDQYRHSQRTARRRKHAIGRSNSCSRYRRFRSQANFDRA